jgi:phage FluMu gp28-like protein
MMDLPRDESVKNDLRMLELIDGIIKLPKVRQADVKDGKIKRHADAAIALALAYHASLQPVELFAYDPVTSKQLQEIERQVRCTAGFGRVHGAW